MPIDLQCPDCEHTFRVPSSMVGQRTLCRGCNSALVVPGETVAEPPHEEIPPRRSRRSSETVRIRDDRPPNWDTPIPFTSPGPIVGVLLIALAASVLILGIYAIAHEPTTASKPAPFTGTYSYATQPAAPSKPEPKPVDAKPSAASDREVILPDREVIVPKFGADSAPVMNRRLPANWIVVRDTNRRGADASFRIHDCATGRIVGAVPIQRDGAEDSCVSVSPSGRWFVHMVDSSIEVSPVAESGAAAFKWTPYGRGGRKPSACMLLSDEWLLTVSGEGSFDLWSIPGGEYIRRSAVAPNGGQPPAFDVCVEKSLLAIRRGPKIEVYPLGDDDFGKLLDFAPDAAADVTSDFQFSSDGKRLIVISSIRDGAAAPADRVDLFDLERKRKSAAWTLKLPRRAGEEWHWCAGPDSLAIHLPERGSVNVYGLADGKLWSALEVGGRRAVQLERTGDRVWMLEADSARNVEGAVAGRLYGFDLPLRTPLAIRKDPIWEYGNGVLELKRPGR